MKWIVPIVLFAMMVGCTSKKADKNPDGHQQEPVASLVDRGPHVADHSSGMDAILVIQTEPETVHAGAAAKLRLMIHDAKGKMLTDFETVHEQKIHLIIVSNGLDQFAHIHPQIDRDGNMTADYTFPTGGTYWLYADHKPLKHEQATAMAELKVAGDSPPPTQPTPNESSRITVDDLNAEVLVENIAASGATRIEFSLTDSANSPVADLQPYMGAMGHLVIISADGKQYVHAHAAENDSSHGKVEFEAHFAKPGIHKAWGQFQRGGKVQIIPFVFDTTRLNALSKSGIR